MSSQLVKLNGRYVYFFRTIESAMQEAGLYDNFIVYTFENSNLFIIGEKDAHLKKRPHLYDWNGALYPYSRLDSESLEEWRFTFLNSIKEYVLEIHVAA